MWPFKKKFWKEISREYLRTEYDSFYSFDDYFEVYAITYQDINSDKRKIKEVWILKETP